MNEVSDINALFGFAAGIALTQSQDTHVFNLLKVMGVFSFAFDKSTHPMSPSAGECDYIATGVFTHPRPEADIW